jgi:molecular chaperone GrpE
LHHRKTDKPIEEDTRKVRIDGTEAGQEVTEPEADSADKRIAELEAKAVDAHEMYLRAVAEMKNIKRRHAEEAETIRDTATKALVMSLLPVVDDMERALETAVNSGDDSTLVTGVQLVLSKLVAALEAVGVKRIPSVGTEFDPAYHEAVMPTEASEEFPNGIISAELRSGYTQHGHVLRPSMVAVARD